MNKESGIANLDGAQLYYEMAGQGPHLVLVHAGIADRRMWNDQFDFFAHRYHVVRYDMRGFGNSPMSSGRFSHRKDLYNLLQFLRIDQAHLIGCSMGGSAVIDLALEHPDVPKSLVLVAAGISGFQFRGELPKQAVDLIAARKNGDANTAAELQLQIWVDGVSRSAEQVDAGVRQRAREMSYVALTKQAAFMKETGFVAEEQLNPPALERLQHITARTLVLIGNLDTRTSVTISDLLATQIAHARKIIMNGTAHLPNMEKPQEFNQIVLEFLE